mmetsp:Transcript_101753/g.286959  ORF Transcript_101753/g.286959 Transcript_101753/m.286959 type:complete len:236 (-) Transcript_101753:773-1480(-)
MCSRWANTSPATDFFFPMRTNILACTLSIFRFNTKAGLVSLSDLVSFATLLMSVWTNNIVSLSSKNRSKHAMRLGKKGHNSTECVVSCTHHNKRRRAASPSGVKSDKYLTTSVSGGASWNPMSPSQKVGTGSINVSGTDVPKARSRTLLWNFPRSMPFLQSEAPGALAASAQMVRLRLSGTPFRTECWKSGRSPSGILLTVFKKDTASCDQCTACASCTSTSECCARPWSLMNVP